MRLGMDARTGAALGGRAHLAQSIRDIITTPRGTRVERREYGSDVPRLVDQPQNQATLLRMMAAAAIAIRRWEPDFVLQRADFSTPSMDGKLVMTLVGEDASADGLGAVDVAVEIGR